MAVFVFRLKRTLYNIVSIMSSRMLARAASAVITFHNEYDVLLAFT